MHWSKYSSLVASNPVLGSCLADTVGPPVLHWGGTHPVFTIQSWVEGQLAYVAVRPWAELDLDVLAEIWKTGANCQYVVYFHIDNVEESPGSRARLAGGVGDGNDSERRTVREIIQSILDWYEGSYWMEPERRGHFPLVFDAIIRDAHGTVRGKKYPEQTINVWIPPEGFTLSTTS